MDERRERILKRVEKYTVQRKYDQAIELLKPLVSQDSRNITLLNMMANTCDLAGKSFSRSNISMKALMSIMRAASIAER